MKTIDVINASVTVCWCVADALSPNDVRHAGSVLYGLTKAGAEDMSERLGVVSVEASKKLMQLKPKLSADQAIQLVYEIVKGALTSTHSTLKVLSGAAWYDEAMPTIEVGHRLAASMLSTRLVEDVVSEIRFPFHSFMVDVPSGLIHMSARDGQGSVPVRNAMFTHSFGTNGNDLFIFHAYSEGGLMSAVMDGIYPTIMEFANHSGGDDDPHGLRDQTDPYSMPVGRIDDRNGLMARRLLLNAALMMSEKRNYSAVGKGHGKSTRRGPPVCRRFRFVKPVSHDFRKVVRAYSLGEGKKLDVQSFVRGHWKSQPHGPGSSLRKAIFVEPYWRGPEDAPIALRKHKLNKR